MTAIPHWYTEQSEDGTLFGLKLADAAHIHSEQTPYQKLDVYQTATFGKLMTLDDIAMITSRDNFVYHEMMAHPVLFSHPAPKRVCIIGGGDCGTLREVMRHPQVEAAILIDIDERVTRVSEIFFPELCEANNDPRVTLAFEDGIAWLNHAEAGSLDVLIVDSTDPIGPGAVLYSEEFFQACWRVLAADGLLVQQSESPLIHAEHIIKPMHDTLLKAGFSTIQMHQFPLVTYPSGWWSCMMAAKSGKISFRRAADAASLDSTRYYTAAMHTGSAALPPFLQQLLAGKGKGA